MFKKSIVVLSFISLMSISVAEDKGPFKRRVKPPEWKKNDRAIFFKNAFRDAIVGKPAPLRPTLDKSSDINSKADSDGEKWSRFISSQTVEDEIKTIKILVDQTVTTERRFKSGNFKMARQRFSELAICFGIVSHFDGDIRWKDQATIARDLFAKSARNASVGTTSAYRDAVARKNDLQDLISGAAISATITPNQNRKWGQFSERKPLMQRLKVAHTERLAEWLSSKSEFKKHLSQIKKEAEILAAFSVILTKDEMEDAGDDDYEAFCNAMRDSALQIIKSVNEESFEQATKANGIISNSCAGCHDNYRG